MVRNTNKNMTIQKKEVYGIVLLQWHPKCET